MFGCLSPTIKDSSVGILGGLPQSFEVQNFKEIECSGQNLRESCTGSSNQEGKFNNRAECLPEQTWLRHAARVWCRLSKGQLWHLCGMASFSPVCAEMMKYEERELKTQGWGRESIGYDDLPPAMTSRDLFTWLCSVGTAPWPLKVARNQPWCPLQLCQSCVPWAKQRE